MGNTVTVNQLVHDLRKNIRKQKYILEEVVEQISDKNENLSFHGEVPPVEEGCLDRFSKSHPEGRSLCKSFDQKAYLITHMNETIQSISSDWNKLTLLLP